MACKIHGIPKCPLPSCVGQSAALCDAHAMENCHICQVVANPTPTNPNAEIAIVAKPPQLIPSPVSDSHAVQILAAAEAYARACQDYATIKDNAISLKNNLEAAQGKLAEALQARLDAQKVLSELMKGDK